MFTLKTRHASVSNFLNSPNPETSSKASSRKQPFFQKYQKDSLRQSQRELESRLSTVLPKIKKNSKVDTANDFFEEKKKQKVHTKDLALAISKYKLHRGQFSKSPSNEISFDIMKVLECFTMVENNFQELFIHMREDLKAFLYLTTNAELAEKYQVKQGEMYKDIVENIDATANKKLKQAYEKVRQANDAKEEIQEEYGRFKLLWEEKEQKYKDQIEYLQKLTNNQYLKYLEEKLHEQTERIQELEISQKSLVQLRDQYEKTMKKQEDEIESKVKQISRLNTIIYDLKISKQQSEKMILKLRDRFDQFNLKMTGIKEMIADVQKENEQLKTERVALIKRAAVSFEELTPRPKYKKIMNFTEKQQLLTLKSTVQIAEVMLKKIGNDAFIEDFRKELFDLKLSNKKQLHPKLQQAEKIREETQISIADSKSDLRQVEKIFAKESSHEM